MKEAELAERGRYFEPDESRTDDHGPRAPFRVGGHGVVQQARHRVAEDAAEGAPVDVHHLLALGGEHLRHGFLEALFLFLDDDFLDDLEGELLGVDFDVRQEILDNGDDLDVHDELLVRFPVRVR